jgi:hypothetical protein
MFTSKKARQASVSLRSRVVIPPLFAVSLRWGSDDGSVIQIGII